jgi:phosphoribosylformimino-5-aminoimidazole carboxamide ribotide isomerase
MQVIPVIDVRGGEVVYATGGDRAAYKSIATPLAKGSEPVAVARGLLAASGARILYMADLDGIAGRRWNMIAIGALRTAFAHVELWVDSGAGRAGQLGELMEIPRVVPVIGSETLTSVEDIPGIAELAGSRSGWVLSLDFKGEEFLGPRGLLGDPVLWPERVIAMTLATVGADRGPDLARVREIEALAGPARQVFAAGGVRDKGDLAALSAAGAAGVLVASALHSGKIKAGDLG